MQMQRCDVFQTVGKLHSVRDLLTANLTMALGEMCEIETGFGKKVKAEVIAAYEKQSQLMTFHRSHGLAPGMDVVALNRVVQVPVGLNLLGRVLNGLGEPIDGGEPLQAFKKRMTDSPSPQALERKRITQPLVTGQRVIDGLLTIGRGQRMGLFAGSGVGKSTLLGEIAKFAEADANVADMNVIVLVGERGREVRPFLEDCLGPEGLKRSVVVVATSDETPLMKIQAVRTGLTIAEEFRDQGADVLFFLDSLTRFATAQKEIGLARGEAPGQRGYPSSVLSTLATTLERLGNSQTGSITGLITVLVDGDDLDEPIADAARSILDGHLVLDRQLAQKGRFPAVNVLKSLSRLFREVTSPQQQLAADGIRECLATYEEVAELIQVGLYQPGTSPAVDNAIHRLPAIQKFLHQRIGETSQLNQTTYDMTHLSNLTNDTGSTTLSSDVN